MVRAEAMTKRSSAYVQNGVSSMRVAKMIGTEGVPIQPMRRIRRPDLESLMNGLGVNFVKLAECRVSQNWRLSFPTTDAPLKQRIAAAKSYIIDRFTRYVQTGAQ